MTQRTDRVAVVRGVSSGIGRATAVTLAERGHHVFGSVRRSTGGASLTGQLGERFTPLVFDVTDAAAIDAARGRDHRVVELADPQRLAVGMEGVRTVHYIPPTYDPAEKVYGANVVAAAVRAGVGRLVYHSVLHAPTPAMPHHWRKAKVEMLLRNSPLAPVDLGEAIARVLTESGHDHATYELAGTKRLSFADMADVIADVMGRPVPARALDPELVLRLAEGRGLARATLEELRLMMAHYDRHGLFGNGRVLTGIIGRETASFAQAVERANQCGLMGPKAPPCPPSEVTRRFGLATSRPDLRDAK